MARAAVLAFVLFALALGVQAEKKAAAPSTFMADTLLNARRSAVKSKTQASSYYGYNEPEVARLTQENFKSCRYTDCMFDADVAFGCLANVAFQTDFSCPLKKHYGDHDNSDLGMIGFSSTVGTCDWEISLYRWGFDDGDDVELTPMLTSDSVVKFGTAWGTCYLNADAENCESPLCERMAISIQGGLYGTLAYSPTYTAPAQAGQDITDIATLLETCAGDLPGTGVGPRRPANKQSAAAKKRADAKKEAKNKDAKKEFIISNYFLYFLDTLIYTARYYLSVNYSPAPGPTPQRAPAAPAPAPAGTAKAQVASAQYDHEDAPQVYPGLALMISGPFYEISNHDSEIQQTGLFELPIYYESDSNTATAPTNNWPIVSVKNAKLRFNHVKKQEGYYGEGREDRHE